MRVCIVPEYPLNLMTGGMQVQAIETCQALQALGGGLSAELFQWSDFGAPADLYHFLGCPDHVAPIMNLVHAAKRPYVVTLLFGGCCSQAVLRKAAVRQFINSQILGRREKYDAVTKASAIITITEADARAAQIIYGVEEKQISIVPHGVADGFFRNTATSWCEKYGNQPFVLCVGAIQQRKNQLLLAEACNWLKLPLTLLGPVLPGERSYADSVKEAMRQNEQFGGRWLTTLSHEDELLHSAYAACRLFALISTEETQPISVMEAMAAKKPVVLLKAPYTTDPLFSNLPAAAAPKVHVVAKILQESWNQALPTALPFNNCWGSIARQLESIYTRIVPGR